MYIRVLCCVVCTHDVCCYAIVSCPALSWSDVHLLTSNRDRLVGSVVTFHCEHGWHVSESLPITCLPDGSWSGAVPTCLHGGRFILSVHESMKLLYFITFPVIKLSEYSPVRLAFRGLIHQSWLHSLVGDTNRLFPLFSPRICIVGVISKL